MNNVDTEELERKISAQPIVRIKIADTFPYSKHPFRVVKNKALEMLAKDIKKNGLLNPIVVRVIGFGGRYEILSGHRRMEGLKLNGEEYADARIMKFNDIEAANVVINSNLLQRDKILPSERAKIYMLRNECLKREKYGSESARRTEITEEIKEILSREFNVSKTSIFEYIRLNNLIDELLIALDEGIIKFKMAVALSAFPKKRQLVIYKYFVEDEKAVLNNEYIKKMKKYITNLTEEILEQITAELNTPKKKAEKPVDTFVKKYVGNFKNEQEMLDRLEKLLIDYLENKKLQRKEGGG
jgi:ParB family chromosome partitioning protein